MTLHAARALLLGLAITSPAAAERDRDPLGAAVPDFARVQTGGWTGAINVAVGYAAFDDVLNASLGYGYTPTRRAGTPVHNLDLSLQVRPIELQLDAARFVPLYAAGTLLYIAGEEFELRYPRRYRRIDENYYPPTALHWMAALGTEVGWHVESGFFERHALYYQVVALDTFVTAYLANSETLTLSEAFSSAVGYRAAW